MCHRACDTDCVQRWKPITLPVGRWETLRDLVIRPQARALSGTPEAAELNWLTDAWRPLHRTQDRVTVHLDDQLFDVLVRTAAARGLSELLIGVRFDPPSAEET
jgi:hypothetical protein